MTTTVTSPAATPEDAVGDPVALLVGGVPEEAVSAFVAARGATVVRAADTAKALALVESLPRGATVAVVASREALTARVLERAAAVAGARELCLGVLTAASLDGIPALTRRAPSREGTGFVQAGATAPAAGDVPALTSRDAVRAPRQRLYVLGHGDGSHLHLGFAALCGRLGPEERRDGEPLSGGCSERDGCKKARAAQLDVLRANELSADLLVLLSCNSLSLAHELYPSDSSIALGALEGGACHVVATTRACPVSLSQVVLVERLIGAGLRIGDVVRVLNDRARREIGATPYVVIGDPLATYAASPYELEVEDIAEPGVVWPAPSGDVVTLPGTTMSVRSAGVPAPADVRDELAAIRPRLADLAARSRDAWGFERAIRHVARGRLDGEPARTHVAAMTRARLRLDDALLVAAAETSAAARVGLMPPVLPDVVAAAAAALNDWDAAAAMLIDVELIREAPGPDGGVGDALFPSLHLWHEREGMTSAGDCSRCGTAPDATSYVDTTFGLSPRVAAECPVCGLVEESGPLRVATRVDGVIAPESDIEVVAEVTPRAPAEIVVQLRDKTTSGAVVQQREQVHDGVLRLPLRLGRHVGRDIWSLRAVAVAGGRVAYRRRLYTP